VATGLDVTIQKGESPPTRLHLEELGYHIQDESWAFDGMDFSLTPEQFHFLTELSEELFPSEVINKEKLYALVKEARGGEPIKGRLGMRVEPKNFSFTLSLQDQKYFLGGG